VIRVVLPAHLRTLARVSGEIVLDDASARTLRSVVDAIEERYPALRGTIREMASQRRRPFVRFFACRRDLSHDSIDTLLPQPVLDGAEPLLIVGAMAGG